MADVQSPPVRGDVFVDVRGDERVLRVSWHHQNDRLVFSLWRGNSCAATFQLAEDEVPALVGSLVAGLAQAHTPAGQRSDCA